MYISTYKNYYIGNKITSLDELLKHEYAFFCLGGKPILYHQGWFSSFQLRLVQNHINHGYVYTAIKRNKDGTLTDT